MIVRIDHACHKRRYSGDDRSDRIGTEYGVEPLLSDSGDSCLDRKALKHFASRGNKRDKPRELAHLLAYDPRHRQERPRETAHRDEYVVNLGTRHLHLVRPGIVAYLRLLHGGVGTGDRRRHLLDSVSVGEEELRSHHILPAESLSEVGGALYGALHLV